MEGLDHYGLKYETDDPTMQVILKAGKIYVQQQPHFQDIQIDATDNLSSGKITSLSSFSSNAVSWWLQISHLGILYILERNFFLS